MDGVNNKRSKRLRERPSEAQQVLAEPKRGWLARARLNLFSFMKGLKSLRLPTRDEARISLRRWGKLAWPLDERNWPKRVHLALLGVIVVSIVANTLLFIPTITHATSRGDGLAFYSLTGNTTPKYRTHSGASNNFSAETSTVAGSVPASAVIQTSPTKIESIAGYVTAGTLQVMCFNGTTWTNEWTATVTNVASRRPFDISYESNSGNAVVTYATGTTGQIGFRTKLSSAGCGSANWAAATTVTTAGNTAAINWIRAAIDPTSNTLGAVFEDSNRRMVSLLWSGSTWTNETTISTAMDYTATAVADTESFALAFESLTGNLMVTWSENPAGQHIFYEECTGGGSACTWRSKTNMPTLTGHGTEISLTANPASNQMVFGSIDGTGGTGLSVGYWSGLVWSNTLSQDNTTEATVVGGMVVSTSWLTFTTTTRSLIVYAHSGSQKIDYVTGNGGTFTTQAQFTPAPVPTIHTRYYQLSQDPYNPQRAMLIFTDSNNNLYAKRAVIDLTAAVTWTNTDGSAALTSTTLSQAVADPAGFAYWNSPTSLDQTIYRWYGNVDAIQPTTALAAENTGITITTRANPLRLRMGLTNRGTDMSATAQAYKLQYATDQNNGPWTDVASASADPWCNVTTSPFCSESWGNRKKIAFSNASASGSISNFPILIRLNTSNFNYSHVQSAGQDLRFVDKSDSTTLLPYDIETWNTSGESLIWVKKPALANTNTDYLFMYYGNGSAAAESDASNVWTNSYLAVYHLSQNPAGTAPQFTDATGNGANATSVNMVAGDQIAGQIGGSISLNGTTKYALGLSSGPGSVKNRTAYTVQAWTYTNSLGARRDVYEESLPADVTKSRLKLGMEATNVFALNGRTADTDALQTWVTSSVAISSGAWYYVSAVWQGSGNNSITVNGTKTSNTLSTSGTVANTNPNAIQVGVHSYSNTPSEFWNGQIDELRVSSVARSDDWINADYRTQSDATFTTYNGEESQGGGVWRYFKNPTAVDGATITANLLTGATAKETFDESKPTPSNPNAIGSNAIGEWDFALDPSSACTGTYYFRMVAADGTVIQTYTQYPAVTLTVGAPVDSVMRHGGWWNNNLKQPYSCDWVPG